jgi:hypothetical protein
MKIQVEVSLGELVDKLTILEIKIEKISDKFKKENAQKEHDSLSLSFNSLQLVGMEVYREQLKQVNLLLWDIEDAIRLKENKEQFDQDFIQLARSVYETNDKRFDIKNKINHHYGSLVKEVKSYEKY